MDVKKIGRIPDGGGWKARGSAAAYFTAAGVTRIERVMTDNAFACCHSTAMREVIDQLGARQIFTTDHARCAAFAPWLEHYTNQRRHSAIGGQPPISRLTPTCPPGTSSRWCRRQ